MSFNCIATWSAPLTQSGRVAEWLVEEGEHVPENALVCIVQTENLVPEEEKTGMFRGTSTLEVELTDGGWVARHLIDTSKEAPVGEPILAVCSSKEEAEQGDGEGSGRGRCDIGAACWSEALRGAEVQEVGCVTMLSACLQLPRLMWTR